MYSFLYIFSAEKKAIELVFVVQFLTWIGRNENLFMNMEVCKFV